MSGPPNFPAPALPMLGPLRSVARKSAPPLPGSAGRYAVLDPLVGSKLPPLVIATIGDIMTRVYGGCVESDGLDLDNDLHVIACPKCDGEAYERFWAACE